jgi:mono/diheme cytochrome c family protein
MPIALLIVLAIACLASSAPAADADRGRRLAQEHCASCHAVTTPRNEVSDAPPFSVIGRKYGSAAPAIAAAILGPHPRMNFAPVPADADDIAAYIGALRQ